MRQLAVTISTWGSLFSARDRAPFVNTLLTTVGALTQLSGGVASSSLSFRRLPEGALTMEVKDSDAGTLFLLLWYDMKASGFVRWEPYRPSAVVGTE